MALNVAPRLRERLQATIAHLPPGYFALVMATGILATAAHLLALPLLAWPSLVIALGAYVTLWVLTLIRLLCYWPQVLADLTDHERGPGFFTLVAATCLLGSTLLVISGAVGIARALWFVGIGLWGVVMYAFFTVVVVREYKPTLETRINGAWLIATVAT
jgi:tellurite resistance protein TehA-like permease